MKFTVTLDSRGAIFLPAELREAFGLKAGSVMTAESTPEGILLCPVVALPLESYSRKRVCEFDEGERELAEAMSIRRDR